MHLFSSSLNQTFQKCLPNFSLYGSFMDATYHAIVSVLLDVC